MEKKNLKYKSFTYDDLVIFSSTIHHFEDFGCIYNLALDFRMKNRALFCMKYRLGAINSILGKLSIILQLI